MRSALFPLAAALLTLAFITSGVVGVANATQWVGSDDGEFSYVGCSGCHLGSVGVDELLSSPLSWSSSPPLNTISLQYNPDEEYSLLYQNDVDWFQPNIYANTNDGGCGQFSTQVYYLLTGASVWRQDFPTSGCSAVQGMLSSEAQWDIDEIVNLPSNNIIVEVQYTLVGGGTGGGSLTDVMTPPTDWVWLRSNTCWCGTNAGVATFSSAGGTSTYLSNLDMQAVSPPTYIATEENSNMQYGCFTNTAYPQIIEQNFGLSGEC